MFTVTVTSPYGQCRWCRCTDEHACANGCRWIDVDHTLCSECAPIDKAMGYKYEIEYFVQCIKQRQTPKTVTLRDAAEAVRIVEAEVESVRAGKQVEIR